MKFNEIENLDDEKVGRKIKKIFSEIMVENHFNNKGDFYTKLAGLKSKKTLIATLKELLSENKSADPVEIIFYRCCPSLKKEVKLKNILLDQYLSKKY